MSFSKSSSFTSAVLPVVNLKCVLNIEKIRHPNILHFCTGTQAYRNMCDLIIRHCAEVGTENVFTVNNTVLPNDIYRVSDFRYDGGICYVDIVLYDEEKLRNEFGLDKEFEGNVLASVYYDENERIEKIECRVLLRNKFTFGRKQANL